MKFHAAAVVPSVLALLAAAGAAVGQTTGPSSNAGPFVLPTPAMGSRVVTTSILTVGQSVNGYTMIGIPDGAGSFLTGEGTFDLVMNHELGPTSGVARAHGSTGAFVSRWSITTGLRVTAGRDHNTSPSDVYTWNGTAYVAGTTAWGRFCSADLAAPGAFRFGKLGTDARIFTNGEESGAEGRAFAHILTGKDANTSWQLPRLGKFSWENSVPCPFAQEKTIVIGTDDSTPGEVYVYVGTKTATGSTIDRAGLTNGQLMGVRVQGLGVEDRATPPAAGTRFDLYNLSDVSGMSGAQIQTQSTANGVTMFLRPEDGAWDPRASHHNDFYFVTTDRFNREGQVGRSRLYRLRFDDITHPENGGSITAVLDGSEGQNMMDNICVDSLGRVIIQEDIGGQNDLGKLWMYSTETDELTHIATHDAALFAPGAAGFLTNDEESSGVHDASGILGAGYFIFDVQAHYPNGTELVEGGQIIALYVDPTLGVPCRADFNRDGGVNSQDFFDFLAPFFANDPAADFNADGAVNSQDFFDFLAAFFQGC
jgi:hypothetical protein